MIQENKEKGILIENFNYFFSNGYENFSHTSNLTIKTNLISFIIIFLLRSTEKKRLIYFKQNKK